jgi:hypothetical protein
MQSKRYNYFAQLKKSHRPCCPQITLSFTGVQDNVQGKNEDIYRKCDCSVRAVEDATEGEVNVVNVLV